MSDNSAIEWTRGDDGTPGATWNPLLGCSRVSPGCDACYAINSATIRAGNPHPRVAAAFAGLTERRDGRLDWTGRVNLLPERLTQPLTWRKPKRIFVNSLADLFHENVPDEYIAKVFAIMAVTPRHTYQLLTKRHGRMRSLLTSHRFWTQFWIEMVDRRPPGPSPVSYDAEGPHLRNVWLGVSVEDQKWADIRIPALLDTPAAVRWLSCEPLLGPLNVTPWLHGPDCPPFGEDCYCSPTDRRISWVVVGGESGPGARPMHPDWARSLRDQCSAAGVPFFFKQFGEYGLLPKTLPDGRYAPDPGVTVANDGTVYQPGDLVWPDGPRAGEAIRAGHDKANLHAMYRVGKKAAGRELDGREWNEMPS